MTIALSPGLLAAINTSYKSSFVRGLQRISPQYPKISMTVNSVTETEVYPFLGTLPTLREWIGNRVAEDLTLYDFAIKNKSFEKTLRVPRTKIEDDQFGIYTVEAENLGDAAARHPDKLIFALLEAGASGKCYDGQAFFSTSHPNYYDANTWSNMGTTALSATSYGVARAQMRGLKDDSGEVLDVFSTDGPQGIVLVVPPALEETAMQILHNDFISVGGGSTQNNVWKGSADLLVVPRLTDANNWYLLDMGKVVKPLIMQMRKPPTLTSRTSLTDDNVFERNEFQWGVDYRGNAGYGLPQLAYGGIVA